MKESLKDFFSSEEKMNDEAFLNSVIEEIYEKIDEETEKRESEIDTSKIEEYISLLGELENKKSEDAHLVLKTSDIKSFFRRYHLRKSKKYVKYAPFVAAAMFMVVGILHFSDSEETRVEKESEAPTVIVSEADRKKPENSTTQKESEDLNEEYYTPGYNYHSEKPEKPTAQGNTPSTEKAENVSSGEAYVTDVPGWADNKGSINKKEDYVTITFENGEEIRVPSEDYEVTQEEESLTETISEATEESKIVSIYGNFENGCTIEGVRVIGVYSDGSEKEIPKENCEINTKKFITDESRKVIVTVSYEGLSFNFTIYNDIKEEE